MLFAGGCCRPDNGSSLPEPPPGEVARCAAECHAGGKGNPGSRSSASCWCGRQKPKAEVGGRVLLRGHLGAMAGLATPLPAPAPGAVSKFCACQKTPVAKLSKKTGGPRGRGQESNEGDFQPRAVPPAVDLPAGPFSTGFTKRARRPAPPWWPSKRTPSTSWKKGSVSCCLLWALFPLYTATELGAGGWGLPSGSVPMGAGSRVGAEVLGLLQRVGRAPGGSWALGSGCPGLIKRPLVRCCH